jgi:hypothetical protein
MDIDFLHLPLLARSGHSNWFLYRDAWKLSTVATVYVFCFGMSKHTAVYLLQRGVSIDEKQWNTKWHRL